MMDLAAVFDQNYLEFYGPLLDGDAASHEAELLLRLLNPAPASRILDAGCGYGRISQALAEKGFAVTGVDAIPAYIEVGRQRASDAGLPIHYEVGDLRSLTFNSDFDHAFMWFGSFGYFPEAENRSILQLLRRAIRPEGRLLIDCPNPYDVVRQLDRAGTVVLEQECGFLIEQHKFDAKNSRLHSHRTTIRDGAPTRVDYALQLYTCRELTALLTSAGFLDVEVYATNGHEFALWSPRMIAVAGVPDDRWRQGP